MKPTAFIFTLIFASLSAFGQGKVAFVNDNNHLFVLGSTLPADAALGGGVATAGVTTGAIPNSPLPSGATLVAVLYAGTSSASLSLQSSTVLTSVSIPGRMSVKNTVLSGINGGSVVNFQIVVTDTGASLPPTIVGGGGFAGASYFGSSGLFTTVPSASVAFNSLVNPNNPAFSTWAAGNVVINSVGIPPAISADPQSRFATLGSNVTFSVTANGTSPLTCDWRKGGVSIGAAVTTNYSIIGVTTNDAGNYDVIVNNAFGSATSSVATLSVGLPPAIGNQPAGQTVTSGSVVTFEVTASGTEPLSYQWQRYGADIASATDTTYNLNPALTNHAGAYAIVITNAFGAITSEVANLTVFIPVAITDPPTDQIAAVGGSSTFTVGANGFPTPNYQWRFKGVSISGSTGSSHTVNDVAPIKTGAYSVVAWNPYSSITSPPAALFLSPNLNEPFMGLTAVWGRDAQLSVVAIGSGVLSYQWYKNGAAIAGATTNTLLLPAIQFPDGGLYSVVVSSAYGSVTNAPAQVVVNPANISLGIYAGLTIEGAPGNSYAIQATTNFADVNSWQTLTNITLTQPVELWVDTSVNVQAPGVVRRLFRVLSQ